MTDAHHFHVEVMDFESDSNSFNYIDLLFPASQSASEASVQFLEPATPGGSIVPPDPSDPSYIFAVKCGSCHGGRPTLLNPDGTLPPPANASFHPLFRNAYPIYDGSYGSYRDVIAADSTEASAYRSLYQEAGKPAPFAAIQAYMQPPVPRSLNIDGVAKDYFVPHLLDSDGFGNNARFQQKMRSLLYRSRAHDMRQAPEPLPNAVAMLAALWGCEPLDSYLSSKMTQAVAARSISIDTIPPYILHFPATESVTDFIENLWTNITVREQNISGMLLPGGLNSDRPFLRRILGITYVMQASAINFLALSTSFTSPPMFFDGVSSVDGFAQYLLAEFAPEFSGEPELALSAVPAAGNVGADFSHQCQALEVFVHESP